MPGDQDARVAQHGPNYLDRCSPLRPPTAPETHPLAQGQATPWAREESPRRLVAKTRPRPCSSAGPESPNCTAF